LAAINLAGKDSSFYFFKLMFHGTIDINLTSL